MLQHPSRDFYLICVLEAFHCRAKQLHVSLSAFLDLGFLCSLLLCILAVVYFRTVFKSCLSDFFGEKVFNFFGGGILVFFFFLSHVCCMISDHRGFLVAGSHTYCHRVLCAQHVPQLAQVWCKFVGLKSDDSGARLTFQEW